MVREEFKKMSKNVIVAPLEQKHNGNEQSGKFENRFANQRIDNNGGNNNNRNNNNDRNNSGNKNNGGNGNQNNPQPQQPINRPGKNGRRPIYQHVTHLRIGDGVFIVPADQDWRYDNDLIVDMRRPRSDVQPSGYIYAQEGAVNLVDRTENPDLCQEIDKSIAEFYTYINRCIEAAAAYADILEEQQGSAKKRIRTAKNAKKDDEAVVVQSVVPAWLKVALISVFAVTMVVLIALANQG
jgi:hypothetical protein